MCAALCVRAGVCDHCVQLCFCLSLAAFYPGKSRPSPRHRLSVCSLCILVPTADQRTESSGGVRVRRAHFCSVLRAALTGACLALLQMGPSPNVVTVLEAALTLCFFFVMVIVSWVADKGMLCFGKAHKAHVVDKELEGLQLVRPYHRCWYIARTRALYCRLAELFSNVPGIDPTSREIVFVNAKPAVVNVPLVTTDGNLHRRRHRRRRRRRRWKRRRRRALGHASAVFRCEHQAGTGGAAPRIREEGAERQPRRRHRCARNIIQSLARRGVCV